MDWWSMVLNCGVAQVLACPDVLDLAKLPRLAVVHTARLLTHVHAGYANEFRSRRVLDRVNLPYVE